MEKRVVIVLLIIAILLSVFSVSVLILNSNIKEVETVGEPNVVTEGTVGGGVVGLEIVPPNK